jgi:hypothetical protein
MVYKSLRGKAYRNLLVCAINEGLRLSLFRLHSDRNGWPDQSTQSNSIDFTLPNGLPARAVFRDIGFGEVSVVVAVNPTGISLDGRSHDTEFRTGDAFAQSWLEREKGAWLQSATTLFNCRRNLISVLAGLNVEPNGFSDHGVVIF